MKKFFIIMLALVLLFAAVSCNNEPEKNPTIPPAPGEIPAEPNSDTEIKSIGDPEKAALSKMYTKLMQVFTELKGGDSPKDISREPSAVAGPAFEASGKITLSTASGLSATVTADENGVFFLADTTELYALIDVITGEGGIILREEGEEETILTIKEGEEDYEIYVNDSKEPLDDEGEEYEALKERFMAAAMELFDGLSESKITIEDVVVSYEGLKVSVSGEASLDVELNEDYDFEDESPLSLIKEGKFAIKSLSIKAEYEGASCEFRIEDLSVSIKDIVLDEDGDLEACKVELSIKGIKLSVGYKDEVTNIAIVFEAMNTSFTVGLDFSKENGIAVVGQTDIGFGLLVDEDSIGLVVGVGVDTTKQTTDPMGAFEITPKAVVINGYYYNPDEFLALIMDMSGPSSLSDEPALY